MLELSLERLNSRYNPIVLLLYRACIKPQCPPPSRVSRTAFGFFLNRSQGTTRSRITRTRLYQIFAYFEGHLPHQKSLH